MTQATARRHAATSPTIAIPTSATNAAWAGPSGCRERVRPSTTLARPPTSWSAQAMEESWRGGSLPSWGSSIVSFDLNTTCTTTSSPTQCSPAEFYTPSNYKTLNANDQDMGNSGVVVTDTLTGGSSQLVAFDKTGEGYVLNPGSLPGYSSSDCNQLQVPGCGHQRRHLQRSGRQQLLRHQQQSGLLELVPVFVASGGGSGRVLLEQRPFFLPAKHENLLERRS